MRLNPELRRNLWLELNPHRFIAGPLVIGLLVALVSALVPSPAGAIALLAALLFLGVTGVWGAGLAHDSVADEIRMHTWDTQRMSALGPFAMGVGKLFGSTLFAWYLGGLLLLLFALADGLPEGEFVAGSWSTGRILAGLTLVGLLLQALGLLAGLVAGMNPQELRANRGRMVGLLLALLLLGQLPQFIMVSGPLSMRVEWYGRLWNGPDFLLATLALSTLWSWLGAWRLLAGLLAVRTLPWAGIAFALFLTLFLAGFGDGRWQPLPVIGLGVGVALTYLFAWNARKEWSSVQRSLRAWRQEPPLRALAATPDWVPMALFTAVWAAVASLQGELTEPLGLAAPGALPSTLLFISLRDVGLLYFFALAARPGRAALTAFVYLTLLHLVVPALLDLFDGGFLANPVLFPAPRGLSWVKPAVAALHLAVVAALLAQRLRRQAPAGGRGAEARG